MSRKHQVLIVGGGSAGITTAAHLLKKNRKLDVAIIDPAQWHYYQPLWTLVGGGAATREKTRRSQKSVIPNGATWIQEAVVSFDPEKSSITTGEGGTIGYDFLIVCPGIQINWDRIPGLKESLGKNGVCSNYSYDSVNSTWDNIRNLKSGIALFTQPETPIKCGGAPQKIMYLAEHHFQKQGVRNKVTVKFGSAKPRIFPVERYAVQLEKIIADRNIETMFEHQLVDLRPDSKEAVFRNLATESEVVQNYDMIHVTPPMSAPGFIASSPLAADDGWVSVNKDNLQHTSYSNVFALGDASNLPTSKTGAAIRKQAPTVAANVADLIAGKPMPKTYNGYTSCPLVTGYGRLILAEFDYDKQPDETFWFDQSKERWSMYMLKKVGLPILYWSGMLRGRA